MARYIKPSSVRNLARVLGKRTSKEFIDALDRHVENRVKQAVSIHNGGKKTLDRYVTQYLFGNQ